MFELPLSLCLFKVQLISSSFWHSKNEDVYLCFELYHSESFRCRKFDVCIANANVQDCRQNIAYNKGKCLRDDDIMHALEIKMSHSANEGNNVEEDISYSKIHIKLI
jgi:hypothetical protein